MAQNKQLLWGDLHNHCGITYGFGDLKYALARAKAHLDFVAITGHAMWPDMYERTPDTAFIVDFHREGFKKLLDHWEEVRDTIAQANCDELVTFQAYEMHSSTYGDHHIVSPDDTLPLIYRSSPAELVRDCGCRAIVIPHHIGYTPGYRGIDWNHFDPAISPVVEVCSKHGCAMSDSSAYPYYHDMGPKDPRNTIYEGLKRKLLFGFVGSTDHHAGYPGSYGDGKLAVWADAKNRESIWQAIQNRHVYAVTGDRILCDFSVDGHPMGSCFTGGSRRKIELQVTGGYWMDKIVVFKNLKPIKVISGDLLPAIEGPQRYKLRIEMGWSNSAQLYQWLGSVKVEGGRLLGVEPCFRGKSVLAPKADVTHEDPAEINNIDNRLLSVDERQASWQCFTLKNLSPQHATTCAVIVELEGNPESRLTIDVNGHLHTKTVAELLEYGYSEHMKPFHSHAYKVHTLVPQWAYTVRDAFEDTRESDCDVYHMEVSQKNNQHAYVSPVFVK